MNKYLLFTALLLTYCYNLHAQNNWEHYYSGKSGLNYLAKQGDYVWATTSGGLAKVNVNNGEVTFFDKINSNIPSTLLRGLAIDAAGDVWVGTEDRGVARLQDTTWTVFDNANSFISANPVNVIRAAPDGSIWVGFKNTPFFGGVAKWNGNDWEYWNSVNSNLSVFVNIEDIAFHPDGSVWLALNDKGIARFDGNTFQQFTGVDFGISGSPQIIAIGIDSVGWVWAGLPQATDDGASVIQYDGSVWYQYSATNDVDAPLGVAWRGIKTGPWGEIWISSGSRVHHYDASSSSWYSLVGCFESYYSDFILAWDSVLLEYAWFYTTEYGLHHDFCETYNIGNCPLPTDQLLSIAVESQADKVWMVPYPFGLALKNGNQWTIYNKDNSLIPTEYIFKIKTDAQGVKWLATGMGLVSYNDVSWSVFDFSAQQFGSYLWDVVLDAQGNKWLCSSQGLGKFDGSQLQIFNTQNSGIPSEDALCAAIELNGTIWVGTPEGLASFDGQNWQTYLPTEHVSSIAIDQNDVKWAGIDDYWSGRLVRIEGDQIQDFNEFNSPLPQGYISHVSVAPDSSIWVKAHAPGLYILHPNGSWTILDSNTSQLSTWCRSAIFDQAGNAWIASNGGAWRYHFYDTVSTTHVTKPFVHITNAVVAPNPAAGYCHLEYELPEAGEVEIALFDRAGNNVLSLAQGMRPAGAVRETLAFSQNLPDGNYWLKIATRTGIAVLQISIQQ